MNFEIKANKVILDKEPNNIDKFVIKFIDNIQNIKYVIVSGYVSILFGRPRTTEDIDILIEEMDFQKFKEWYIKLVKNGFETVNVEDEKELFDLLKTDHSIRFCGRGSYIPNMEVKFAKKAIEKIALNNPLDIIFGKKTLKISPIELQIAYKLYLGKAGNEKDIEDARYLFRLFKNSLNRQKINEWLMHFNIIEMVKYLE